MNPLSMLWTDLRVLLVNTTRVWWRLLPQLLAVQLLGWLSFQLALRCASIVADVNPWPALVIFAAGFIGQLSAVVISLRMAGRVLGVTDLIPAEERDGEDGRDTGVGRLLALTLLPFLGIYAAFGYLNDAADQLVTESFVRQGVFGRTILQALDFTGLTGNLILAAIIIGTYLVRRGLDLLHERTEWRAVGVLVAITEAFFILTVLLSGQRVLHAVVHWIGLRAFVGWIASVRESITSFLGIFKIDLPSVAATIGHFISDQAWPLFWQVVSEPIVWLAVAALIFGSKVLTIAELWRRGRPLTERLPGAQRIARRHRQIALSSGARKAALEFREAFLGDIDDKYLPTVHSVRLVLRAGVIFIGAYILVYSLQEVGHNYLVTLTHRLIGGHPVDVWVITAPFLDLIYTLPLEPWRLCLLAVAFHRCLQLLRAKAYPLDLEHILPRSVSITEGSHEDQASRMTAVAEEPAVGRSA